MSRELVQLLDDAVAQGVCPGGVLLVADRGKPVLRLPFGRLTSTGPAVTLDTVYDVASLTKPVATMSVVLRLIEAGRLAWDTPAGSFLLLPPDKQHLRVRDLAAHSSGLPAWRPFYQTAQRREDFPALAAAEPLEYPTGSRAVYSDLGFMLLGALCERAGYSRLDELAARTVFAPLGMDATRFVDLTRPERPEGVAPTEICPRRGLVVGEVHDDNCHAAGGILGHAGLFSTAGDLSRFAGALCDNRFPEALVREMWTPSGVPGSTWRLGWDSPSETHSQAGTKWPLTGVGHLGFTGCSLWIDPAQQRWVVLLTNRVHPRRDDDRIKTLRPAVHDLAWDLLDQALC